MMPELFDNKSVEGPRRSVQLFSAGRFGMAIGRRLRPLMRDGSDFDLYETRFEDDGSLDTETWPPADVRAVAAWRAVPDLCELLDRECRKSPSFIFVPLILESTALQVGPVIFPHFGPCWDCWRRRYLQHSSSVPSEVALNDFYATNSKAGPQGYLETYVAMGAARLGQAIVDSVTTPDGVAGLIWQIDMVSREITTSFLQGVHDCPQCGLARPVEDRTTADLKGELAYLWTGDKAQVGQ